VSGEGVERLKPREQRLLWQKRNWNREGMLKKMRSDDGHAMPVERCKRGSADPQGEVSEPSVLDPRWRFDGAAAVEAPVGDG